MGESTACIAIRSAADSGIGLPEACTPALSANALDHLLMPPLPGSESLNRLADMLENETRGFGAGRRLDRIRPLTGLSAAIGPAGGWIAVPTGQGAERFGEALLPSRIAGRTGAVVAILGGSYRESPCGLLASFAHPRQRLALAAQGDRAAAAEIAAAAGVRVAGLAGRWQDREVVVIADTLLAAQLIWWAFHERRALDDEAGAWEQPDIQRLTRLDQVPRRPEDLSVAISGEGVEAEAVARLLRDRLGSVAATTGRT